MNNNKLNNKKRGGREKIEGNKMMKDKKSLMGVDLSTVVHPLNYIPLFNKVL
jgi:hypothetical protein